jgi:hypothetical protein
MARTKAKYITDTGEVFTIYLASETLAAANNASGTGTLTNNKILVKASAGSGKPGLSPRKVNLRRSRGTIGTGADAYTAYKYASLVYCTPAGYNAALSANTIAYKGADWEPVSGTAES